MLRRRVAELYKPTTVHYTLRMDGWTLILGRPSRAKKIVLCIYWTRMRAGWRSHPAICGSMVAEQHQGASPDINIRERRSIMVFGSICLEIYIFMALLTGTRRVMGTPKGILWRLTA